MRLMNIWHSNPSNTKTPKTFKMAYNNNNKFLKIKEIQDLFLLHKQPGVTTRHVYKTQIYPRYRISIATFYNYMGINVRKELKNLNLVE